MKLKMKTRRAAAKRFKKTASGEFKRAKGYKLLPAREICAKLL